MAAVGRFQGACLLVPFVLLTACHRETGNPAPPREEGPAVFPQQVSTIVIPVSARLADLEARVNQRVPTELWQIDRYEQHCVPAQRVKILGRDVKLTPALGCRIVGQVRRGTIRLGGSGDKLVITMPVTATISAHDVGGILKKETATGAAQVRAQASFGMRSDWTPTATVSIAYDWTEPPGIDFLGHRIPLISKADERLKAVIARLQRELPAALAALDSRRRLDALWVQAFTSIELNRDKPPAWMRITPRRLGVVGYRVNKNELQMMLSAEALTETFVGDRPSDPVPRPLPPPTPTPGAEGLHISIPVLADYRQIEPVVDRALAKLAAKGISLPGIGPVEASFGKVTLYATKGGRLAVGIPTAVRARDHALVRARGTVWLSAAPYNDANSQLVRFRDLRIAQRSDNRAVGPLFAFFANQQVLDEIQDALAHDFAKDYDKVLAAARKALAERHEGDFVLSASITSISNGLVEPTGQGLFLPIRADGEARIDYRPH
ncbi:DUF4403 family protein [Flavisphingomonas formosensis]|uniref:DUF4403 family protein n=1 Tax=Flavisphingomonas formosensis TaxID=861534 RepID=UPI0012F77A0E|nr:DUF4403 family protein [Sphingomonas formosensis]